ncbi:D-alanine-D-alanine ligase [Croceitalea dokdonensis DOKDO 023]|uniref:D-alanine-D-alanine ligase n=1 Tax=Croceitalea dokdonensis DOKDO 023 TaxID=1300341 RepID=A0A0P7AFI6_9FLAO|nr:hypothetical protein [Croceitalea dokdonensis]KPM32078.1 D-alanine-D-alanine ligase [Croceitalea dokdonensis DOKDO 023]
MLSLKYKPWYIKLFNVEYWPSWFFYIPVWIQHTWLAIKTKNLFFFLSTNPAIDGFILSDSKFKTLQLVPEAYRPKMLFVNTTVSDSELFESMKSANINFPIILKPDIGFRGLKVSKIDNIDMLKAALTDLRVDYIIQEYIEAPLEVGIFYYRYPNEIKGHIPSVTVKAFLKITGDGNHSLAELVYQNPRALLQKDILCKKFSKIWNSVIPKGVVLTLEEIGNHNRGTKFINGNDLVDDALLEVFDNLSHSMKEFYFGRFDIKVASIEALKKEGDYKILEVNGVGGEPTHIYDSNTSVFKAWKDLCFTWRVAAKIAAINFEKGIEKPTYRKARAKWDLYASYKTKLYS